MYGVVIYGVDLSNHNWGSGPMDFASMRTAGVQFLTHKCTDGNQYYRDPYFAQAMSRARSAGVPLLGAYHVLWGANPVAQMQWFVQTLDATVPWWRTGPFILQLDCEPFSYNGGAPSKAAIQTACDTLVHLTGGTHRPVVYAPRWVYGDTLAGLSYPLWASNYGSNPTVTLAGFAVPATRWTAYSGQTPAIVQFGSMVTVGTQPQCDGNVFNGSLADLTSLVHPASGPALPDTQEDGVHLNLKTGESCVFTSNAVVGGVGWLMLSAAFGDCTARVARYSGGWTDAGTNAIAVKDSGSHVSIKLDTTTGEKYTVENRGPGLLSVDTFPDHAWN